MKTYHFFLQGKGGVGKSFRIYQFALREQAHFEALFLDVDNSTQTSHRQLAFLHGQKRVAKLSLFDDRDKQDRQRFPQSLLQLASLPYARYYFDFGAPESEQFIPLLRRDVSARMLKQIEDHLGARFVFHMVIAGNTAFQPCVEYLVSIVEGLAGLFPLEVHQNEHTFVGVAHEEQRQSLATFCQHNQLPLHPFGAIDADSHVGRRIVHYAQMGQGMEAYGFLEQLKMQQELDLLDKHYGILSASTQPA